jgi:HD-GYP domain-containing protein (c-di-GMP phosphodiesterase class II)
MTSDRPQRAAYSHEAAMGIIEERTPAEYDPRVVAALKSVASVRTGSVLPLPVRTNG